MGLPVRLTESVDRRRGIFRNPRGVIVGWAPDPAEEKEEVDGDHVLSHMPLCTYVYFPGATWEIHEDLDVGVYPLPRSSRTWKVNV